MERIVLGYSGALDTSVAIPWLAERFGAEVVAVTMDLGQGRELADIRERALAAGAVRAHVLDVRDELARAYILPALQAGAVHHDRCTIATALSRPLIARKLVEIAHMEGAAAIAHGCGPNNQDHVRLERSARALDPSITIIAPAREWGMTPADQAAYATQRNIPLPAAIGRDVRTHTNLLGRWIECSVEHASWEEPPDDLYMLTRAPQLCPDEPAYIDVAFEAGVPVRANGIEMPLLELIESIETIAGAHGVGRTEGLKNRLAMREICEAPAALVLDTAHAQLQTIVVSRELGRLSHDLGRAYADLIEEGLWFSPARDAIDAFVASIQRRVTGSVRLKLFKGDCRVVGRRVDGGAPTPLDVALEPIEKARGR